MQCNNCTCTYETCSCYSPNADCAYEKDDKLHQSYSHHDSETEEFIECQNEYLEGNWCV